MGRGEVFAISDCLVLHVLGNSTSRKQIVRAMYDYSPATSDDLGFNKGDRMEVLKAYVLKYIHKLFI